MQTTHLQALMQKEVSRKECLGIMVLAVASIFGFSTVIELLTGKSLGTHKSLVGYSGSGYGGKNKTTPKVS